MRDLPSLVRDLRAAGIPWNPVDDSSYPLPFPVRLQRDLHIALGHLVKRPGSGRTDALRRRVLLALDRVQAIGQRSRFAGWFPPVQQTPPAPSPTVAGCS